ncbi:MAG: DUF1638 domain-containing protein [Rhodoferax sp.]|nr:DUF1638 domain-containing protein [Rhodoferax sp.]
MQTSSTMGTQPAILIIACGALAHEIVALRNINRWPHLVVQCLPADLHNRPEKIPAAVRTKIQTARGRFQSMFVAYADCGTGGLLDKVLAEEGVERIPGAHCYEFFAGSAPFEALTEAEIGTFYLTDFLLTHFDRLILRGLGIAKHPELMPMYFGHYKKLCYLGQVPTPERLAAGQAAADRLGLQFEFHATGYGGLATSLAQVAMPITTKHLSTSHTPLNTTSSPPTWQN